MSYDDYTLGFKRPPRWAQFKPGQSGNPKGRPKKAKKEQPSNAKNAPSQVDEIFRAQLDRTVTLTEGGKPKNMKMREVVSQSQINLAAKGNVFAQREVLKEARQLELRDAERARALVEQEKAQRLEEIAVYKHMILYKAQRETEWAKAAALGSEPDDIWPHPDDILLYPRQQRWTIRGPASEACLPFINWCRAERDYLFAYSILEDQLAKKGSYNWSKIYMAIWMTYDFKLPLRWQIGDRLEVEYFNMCILTTKKLRALVDERQKRAEYLKSFAGIANVSDKETYRTVNMIMKPLLKKHGYHSLAQLEHAVETAGENMS